MDLHQRLELAWRYLDDADRDEVVHLTEDLAADRPGWWAEHRGRSGGDRSAPQV